MVILLNKSSFCYLQDKKVPLLNYLTDCYLTAMFLISVDGGLPGMYDYKKSLDMNWYYGSIG